MSIKLFVYGSLRSNGWNNSILRGSKFLGETETLPCFSMVEYSSFPAVLADGDTAIKGEVFEISEDTLKWCDQLEGHPHWYRRIEVETNEFGKVWMYCMNPEHVTPGMPLIKSGEWRGLR